MEISSSSSRLTTVKSFSNIGLSFLSAMIASIGLNSVK